MSRDSDLQRVSSLAGVGPARARSLEEAGFRTVRDIAAASEADLQQVAGIGKQLAARIKERVKRPPDGEVVSPEFNAEAAIRAKDRELGGANGPLGARIGKARTNADGVGKRQRFRRGHIYWAPRTGAHALFDGPVFDKWNELGRELVAADSLRYPVTDEQRTTDGDGSVQQDYKLARPVHQPWL